MYSSPNFQIIDLVNNIPEVIKDEKGIDIEIATQFEPTFYTENERKAFYTSYNREDEQENINFNHCKIPTVYCPPRYRNLLSIHMLSELSSKPQEKYQTAKWQQRFVPAPGACLAYQPQWVVLGLSCWLRKNVHNCRNRNSHWLCDTQKNLQTHQWKHTIPTLHQPIYPVSSNADIWI